MLGSADVDAVAQVRRRALRRIEAARVVHAGDHVPLGIDIGDGQLIQRPGDGQRVADGHPHLREGQRVAQMQRRRRAVRGERPLRLRDAGRPIPDQEPRRALRAGDRTVHINEERLRQNLSMERGLHARVGEAAHIPHGIP